MEKKFYMMFILLFCVAAKDGKNRKSLESRNMSISKVPTVGRFPSEMPRDIVAVDTIYEHIILGQVLESLVSADREGRIQPGIAKHWYFSKNALSLTLKIDVSKKFSNGKNILAEDVVYSLNMHHTNKTSQTHKFLNSIKQIRSENKDTIVIEFHEPRVAIIKVLSREQLGIVPKGWIFNKASKEPYIGSGAYRLVKTKNNWSLVLNKFFPVAEKNIVPEWRVLSFDDKETPDHMPFVSEGALLKEGMTPASLGVKEQLSFVQSCYWWHPLGHMYKDVDKRNRVMSFLHEVVLQSLKNTNKKRATGVIPTGVAGSLQNVPDITKAIVKRKEKEIKVKIAVQENLFSSHFGNSKAIEKLKDKYRINLEVRKIDFVDFTLEVKKYAPDVLLVRWAGGFNDPEGFLTILSRELGLPLKKYHNLSGTLYEKAKKEQDWTLRNELFRKIGESLVLDSKMVPTWKTPFYTYVKAPLKIKNVVFRYTPKLIDVIVGE